MEITHTDVLLIIFKELNTPDILNIALTCSRFASVVKQHFAPKLYFRHARKNFPRIMVLIGNNNQYSARLIVSRDSASLTDYSGIIRGTKKSSVYYIDKNKFSPYLLDVHTHISVFYTEYATAYIEMLNYWK